MNILMLPNVSVKAVKDNIIPAAPASAVILSPHWYCSAFPSKMHFAGFPSANLQLLSPFSFLNLQIFTPDGLINLQVSRAQLPYKSRIYFYETLNLDFSLVCPLGQLVFIHDTTNATDVLKDSPFPLQILQSS